MPPPGDPVSRVKPFFHGPHPSTHHVRPDTFRIRPTPSPEKTTTSVITTQSGVNATLVGVQGPCSDQVRQGCPDTKGLGVKRTRDARTDKAWATA